MNYTDIIWDFDGTLFDTYPSIIYAFKMALKDDGIEAEDDNIHKYIKISVSDAINYFSENYSISESFINRFKAYEKEAPIDKIVPFKYAKEICEEIAKNGGKNFILTHRGNSTYKYLKAYNMEKCFTEVVNKHSGFKRKPHPEAFNYLIDKYEIDKSKALVVGDRELEIMGAKNSNISSCLYDTNNVNYSEKPDFIIYSLEELKKILFD